MKSIINNIKPKHIIFMILLGIILYFLTIGAKEGFKTLKSFDEYPLPPIEVNALSKYTAVIVEPRKHKALDFVLNNFVDNLDDQWSFVIIHGNLNETFVKDIVSRLSDINKSRIQLVNLGVDNLTIAQYSEMFYNPLFYDYIPTETFLIFQTDSIIIKEHKNKIYDFIDYDYVGAPFGHPVGEKWRYHTYVGNGGLSLRKKSKMVEMLRYKNKPLVRQNRNYGKYVAEDRFFCGYYTEKEIQMNKPSVENAKFFSMESVYSDSPFGIHKPWYGVDKNNFKNFLNKYPEVSTLIRLN